jgi:cytoskeletal protein RodZ
MSFGSMLTQRQFLSSCYTVDMPQITNENETPQAPTYEPAGTESAPFKLPIQTPPQTTKRRKVLIITAVLLIFLVLFGAASYFYWQNSHNAALVTAAVQSSSSPKPTKSPAPSSSSSSISTADWKTYASTTGSGLTFKYPANWFFQPPAKPTIFPNGRNIMLLLLSSEKPQIVNAGTSSQQVENEYMQVTLNDGWGPGNYTIASIPTAGIIANEDFLVGKAKVSLVTSKNQMQLYSTEPVSKESAFHVALNNEHYLVATASWNTYTTSQKDINMTEPEVQQAKLILKSIQLVNS